MIGRLYVPVVSLVLVFLLGNWATKSTRVDPLTAAQNPRIRFQNGGEAISAIPPGVTETEAALAKAVLPGDEVTCCNRVQLLYAGNSQALAIMDSRSGDMLSAQWLQIFLSRHAALRAYPIDVRLGALPNMTMTEFLIKLIAGAERIPRQVDIFLAAAVLEEFRAVGVREEVATLIQSPQAKAVLKSLVSSNTDLAAAVRALEPFLEGESPSANIAANKTAGDSSAVRAERLLQELVEGVPLFAQRQNLLVRIYMGYYDWRNHLLGITSATSRPVPDATYRSTLELIEMGLRYAQSKGIHVVFYLAPIRPIQPNPNLPGDVARFRRDLPSLCQRYGAICLDYVDLIPEDLWTNYPDDAAGTNGQRDFAHFTGMAHKMLADHLLSDIGSRLVRWAQEKATGKR